MEHNPVMAITVGSVAHVRLTVTDIARSRAFYESVFDVSIAVEAPADADEATREKFAFLYGGVIYRIGDTRLGLRPVGAGAFDEDRVGLDHLSFTVAGRADLDAAVDFLDGLGIAHGDIREIGGGWILEFRDPDNIALELLAPKA